MWGNAGEGRGADCCCPDGGILRGLVRRPAPTTARPAKKRAQTVPAVVCRHGLTAEIHVIDARSLLDAAPEAEEQPIADERLSRVLRGHVTGLGVADRALFEAAAALAMDADGDGVLDPAIGHGMFIQGILQRLAGDIVTLWPGIDSLGAIDDEMLADLIGAMEGVTNGNVQILNLSLSGYTENDEAPGSLEESIKNLQGAGWLVVASAGNNASCRLAWPAALDGVVSVGAVGPDGPAWFSNHGPWVSVCAPGVDIVSEFPNLAALNPGLMRNDEDDVSTFDSGWARWSGTSFSAPVVAATIANMLSIGAIYPGPNAYAIDNPVGLFEPIIDQLVHDPALLRLPGLGTVVNNA